MEGALGWLSSSGTVAGLQQLPTFERGCSSLTIEELADNIPGFALRNALLGVIMGSLKYALKPELRHSKLESWCAQLVCMFAMCIILTCRLCVCTRILTQKSRVITRARACSIILTSLQKNLGESLVA